jgi:hypothetical protein
MNEPISNADELNLEITRLRSELAAEQSDRSATAEIARQRGAVINALCADIADLKERIDKAYEDVALDQRTNATLRAENAALKAQADPLAEMWAALAEYQPQADRYCHGDSWRRMCEERTEEAALAASRVATWVAARAVGYAARAVGYAARDAGYAVAEIRRAKEAR